MEVTFDCVIWALDAAAADDDDDDEGSMKASIQVRDRDRESKNEKGERVIVDKKGECTCDEVLHLRRDEKRIFFLI